MSYGNLEVLAPREIIIPSKASANQLTTANTGTLNISGSKLIFFDGTNYRQIAAHQSPGINGTFVLSGATLTFSGGLLVANA